MNDVAANSLNKFLLFAIARLNAMRNVGGNIHEAYEAFFLGEEAEAWRMLSDAEYEWALRTRACRLLTMLENS